jgi:hypothetical protein
MGCRHDLVAGRRSLVLDIPLARRARTTDARATSRCYSWRPLDLIRWFETATSDRSVEIVEIGNARGGEIRAGRSASLR